MPEPSDERVTHRGDPAGGRNGHGPPERLPPNPPLQPQHLSEGEVAAERLPLGDEINATSGLAFGQSELGNVDELPGVNLDRRRRPLGDVTGGGGAETAVAVEDEDVPRGIGHHRPSRLNCENFGIKRPTRRP